MRLFAAKCLTVLFGLAVMFALLPWIDDEPGAWTRPAREASLVSSGRG